jgi:hypothetical protein
VASREDCLLVILQLSFERHIVFLRIESVVCQGDVGPRSYSMELLLLGLLSGALRLWLLTLSYSV